jgi:glycosyltransferase involved in cell wall biosynthesis
MHILVLAPGNSVHSQRFIQLLLDDGHTVTAMDLIDPLKAGSPCYQFLPFPKRIRGLSRLGRWGRNLERLLLVARLWRLWKRVKPDIVNVQWLDERAWFCARAGLRPLVLHCWGSDVNSFFGNEASKGSGREQVKFSLEAADFVTADSREVLARCEELADGSLRTQLYYLGVDTRKFGRDYSEEVRQLRQRLGIGPGQRVILSVRRLHPGLGQEHIVRAFASISRDETLPETVLVLRRYLSAPEYETRIRNLILELGVQSKVAWLEAGSYNDVPIHYALADIVVNYPEQDAFPVSLCEAAASRRPTISSDLSAYRGLFENALIRVPPNRSDLLALALGQGLTDAADIAQKVELAHAAVLEIGDQEQNIQQLGRLFASLCDR